MKIGVHFFHWCDRGLDICPHFQNWPIPQCTSIVGHGEPEETTKLCTSSMFAYCPFVVEFKALATQQQYYVNEKFRPITETMGVVLLSVLMVRITR